MSMSVRNIPIRRSSYFSSYNKIFAITVYMGLLQTTLVQGRGWWVGGICAIDETSHELIIIEVE